MKKLHIWYYGQSYGTMEKLWYYTKIIAVFEEIYSFRNLICYGKTLLL